MEDTMLKYKLAEFLDWYKNLTPFMIGYLGG